MATSTVGFTGSLLEPVSITSGPTVSVSKFGAVGDGKRDDTAAIQSALDYIKAHGGTLNFEAGKTYIVSERLKIVGAEDFKIDGNDATIKMANGVPVKGGNSILHIEGSSHFAVAELTVDGNRANRSPAEVPAHNIFLKDSHDFSFSEVNSINAVADGFYLRASDKADPSTFVTDGLFLNSRADNGFRGGLSIINGDNIQVIGGAYTNSNGTKPAAGIDVEPNLPTAVPGNHNILIKDATFAGNDGYGVQLSAKGKPTNITIEGSHFSDNDRGGIKLGSASTLIKGNTFENFSEAERAIIYVPAAHTNSNNVIADNSFNDIHTGTPVIFAHRASGTNNEAYDNKFYKIDGPILDLNTSGTTEHDNVSTNGPTSPASSPEPTPALASGASDTGTTGEPTPDPATSGGVVNGTNGNDQLVAAAEPETVSSPASPASAPEPTPALASDASDTGTAVEPTPDPATSGGAVNGTNGNDQLVATAEPETVKGYEGNDTFVFKAGFGKDTITDFQAGAGEGDVIEFDDSTFADLQSVLAHATQSGSDVVVAADDSNTITLKNVAVSDLHADDFRFV